MSDSNTKNFPPKAGQPKAENRPPVVVVVGHVDHGKTSLLDYIRKTNVAGKEAGGITQSVGAYEIEVPQEPKSRESEANRGIPRQTPRAFGSEAQARRDDFASRKITFIDTPGHEAFSKMRVRGAHVADVGILVVAADEGVKPQTKEAIKALQDSETPFVVALTKIDKPAADIDRVKNELMVSGVLLEGYGGSVSFQGVSSKTGEGVNELLDLILLASEMEDLSYDLSANASGIVLEAQMDSKRGNTVTIILKNGILRRGDLIATPTAKGKVKILENFLGELVPELAPSSPAVIIGFESLPAVGEEFRAGKLSDEEMSAVKKSGKKFVALKVNNEQTIRVLLKADVSGSLEALHDLLKKIPLAGNQTLEIIGQSVGEISDNDVKDALAMKAIIIGFRVYPSRAAENLARVHGIKILTNEIIYKLVEEMEKKFLEMKEGEYSGELEILATFSAKGNVQTIGGKVAKGKILNKAWSEVRRGEAIIGKGKVVNLQQGKKDTGAVGEGNECGLIFDSEVKIQVGDILLQAIK